MARPLRLEHPGALWHITVRGNQRKEIFRTDEDREAFLRTLGRTVTLFRWRLLAWVLMGNHYHLLLETPEPTLSRGMRDLNSIYTQGYNRRNRRTGHVLQGRFKSILVERETHLLELCRYVVLNPVRAGIAAGAGQWRWSSFRATAGLERAPEWLDVDGVLELFGKSEKQAVLRYRRFVQEGKRSGYAPWTLLEGQIYLGSDTFRTERRKDAARLSAGKVAERPRRPLKRDRKALVADVEREVGSTIEELKARPRLAIAGRRRAAALLREKGLLSMSEIGQILGVAEWQASALVRAGRAHDESL